MTSETKEEKTIQMRPDFLATLIADLESTPQVTRYLVLRKALEDALKEEPEEEEDTVVVEEPEVVEEDEK